MSKSPLPQAHNWTNYWRLDQTQQFTRVSWSKRRIMRVLAPFASSGKKALDAGCGSGFFSKYFCDQNMDVVALDYAQGALDIARRMTEGKATLVQEDLVKPELAKRLPQRFDLIFSDGLMEHFSLQDQDHIFQNLKSVLRDDGVLITFVPNKWSPWELIRPFYMPGIEEKPFVLRELIALNERNGFKVIEQGGLNTLPWAFSPDKILGTTFGMLLYTISRREI